MSEKRAIVFGGSGIIGRNVAERLVSQSWDVVCVSRHAHNDLPGSKAIACDLTDSAASQEGLQAAEGTPHAFICNWSRQASEVENCRVNAMLVRNALKP